MGVRSVKAEGGCYEREWFAITANPPFQKSEVKSIGLDKMTFFWVLKTACKFLASTKLSVVKVYR